MKTYKSKIILFGLLTSFLTIYNLDPAAGSLPGDNEAQVYTTDGADYYLQVDVTEEEPTDVELAQAGNCDRYGVVSSAAQCNRIAAHYGYPRFRVVWEQVYSVMVANKSRVCYACF